MSDLQLLFAVLVALYLWECACWLRRGSVAFTSWFGKRWCLVHPGALVGNQRGGFILAAPLPPLGFIATASQFPISVSPDGVLTFVSTNVNPGLRGLQNAYFMPFDEMKWEIRARGRKVFVNVESFTKMDSPAQARRLAVSWETWRKLKPAQREAALTENLRNQFDVKTAEKLWQEAQPLATFIRWLANLLFVYLFAFVPFVIWRHGISSTWVALLIALVGLTITIAFFFRRAHRRLFPKSEDERFTHSLTIALAPTSATRAHDALLRPLFESFHPLVPAKLFLDESEFRQYARRLWRDVKYPAAPICPVEDSKAKTTELFHRAALSAALERFLKQAGVDVKDLERAPKREESCQAYCPRCESQFVDPLQSCADCGGLDLIPFGNRE